MFTARHQSGSETLSKEERTRVAAQVEHLRDTLDGYGEELGEFADAVRDPVQRAYEYAGCLMEQLVGLRDVHDLKRTASEIATEPCRLDQHIEGVRSELGTNIHPATVTGDSYREGHPHPAPSEPHR
ncbi:hypothetical protein Rt10032_c17g5789 [Rhodotorula toruloides]|uniref:Uncharacterized protein n=1 Tax=Rhodotorula toruloides TaxID=5286 RepID=A0A511KN12_RHOTO|nr:hypothetical protein Rt10032_c17g5789 [Rhodotorula toruloides]